MTAIATTKNVNSFDLRMLTDRLKACESFQATFSCAKKDAYSKLLQLKEASQNLFERTSRIYRLFDYDCHIKDNDEDLFDLKLQAQCLMIHKNTLHSVTPTDILAFAIELETKAIAYIGFATYPKYVMIDDELVTVHNSNKMHWKSMANVKNNHSPLIAFCAAERLRSLMAVSKSIGVLDDYRFE
jgi:hypothetical protein